eukprot:ANDGO_03318.mRNA.1 Protein pim1
MPLVFLAGNHSDSDSAPLLDLLNSEGTVLKVVGSSKHALAVIQSSGDSNASVTCVYTVSLHAKTSAEQRISKIAFFENMPIASISCSDSMFSVVSENGTAFLWGLAMVDTRTTLQHGDHWEPLTVVSDELIVESAVGEKHCVFLTQSGKVLASGYGPRGETGQGAMLDVGFRYPRYVKHLLDQSISRIVSGPCFTLCISDLGQVYFFGDNSCGLSADGMFKSVGRARPVAIGEEECVISVSAGFGHVVAQTLDGSLFSWGVNVHGQLGHSYPNNAYVATAVNESAFSNGWQTRTVVTGSHWSAVLDDGGDLYMWGFVPSKHQAVPVPTLQYRGVDAIIPFGSSALILVRDDGNSQSS